MLHDRPRHHHADIESPHKPRADERLRVPRVLLPRYNEVEVEAFLTGKFQPPGEEVFDKSQSIAFGRPGLDSDCIRLNHVHSCDDPQRFPDPGFKERENAG